MPIYEYRCSNCYHHFEELQKVDEDGENLTCPKCGEPKPSKIVSSFASGGGDSWGGGTASSGTSCSPGFG